MTPRTKELLTRIRTVTGWTQQQVAERLHVSRNYVSLLESGDKTPSVRLLIQLEELLTKVEYSGGGKSPSDETKLPQSIARPVPADRIRRVVETSISAASGDPNRLGWLLVQAENHLRPPMSWSAAASQAPPSIGAMSIEEIKQDAKRAAYLQALEIVAETEEKPLGKTARGEAS